MKKIRKKKIVFLLLAAMGMAMGGCKKFVDLAPAPDLVESGKVFANDNTAKAAAIGVYTQLRSLNLTILNGGLSVYTGLSSDELQYTGAAIAVDQFAQNNILPDNTTLVSNFWTWAYKPLYAANAVLEGVQASHTLTDSVKQQLMGEMKLVRAMLYFSLVNLFGDVPLQLTTDYRANAVMPRTTAPDVYRQIITDLKAAQSLLKPAYPSVGKGRPNYWSATAMLARVLLYTQEWPDAEKQATVVINSGAYSLVANINNIFPANSPETIWELVADNSNTAEGAFVPASTTVKPTYTISNALLSAFEAGDARKTAWTKSNTVSGQPYYYPYKYRQRTTATPVTEYQVLLRLAELFLIRAEARAKQQDLAGARSDLNRIRNRAGLPNTNATDDQALLAAVMQERRIELFAENGHRWFDLRRTGKMNVAMSAAKGANWQPTDALYPIPSSQLELNTYLVQNPGY